MQALSENPTAQSLQPVLDAIAKEVRERTESLHNLEETMSLLTPRIPAEKRRLQLLSAEAATHRRELRHAQAELQHLAWSVN